MVRIVVDLEKLRSLETGLGQVCLELSRALLAHRRADEELAYFLPAERNPLYEGEPVSLKPVHRWAKRGLLRPLQPLARLAPGPHYDLWHITNQGSRYEPWNPRVPVLLTVHDLNFLREKPPHRIHSYVRDVQRRVDRASRVTAISNFVADELRQWVDLRGKQLDVVYNGAPTSTDLPMKPSFAAEGPFLFSIGCFAEKKNFHALVQMLPHLPGYRLVLAGKNDTAYGTYVRQCIAESPAKGRIVLPGIVAEQERLWLYQNCTALVFPSLTEGFGLPPIEAMSAGKPVFLSTLTSLPEVGGDAAFYWQNFEPREMARVVEQALQQATAEPGFADRMRRRARQFTWDRAAQQYLTVYREMIAEQRDLAPYSRAASRRPAA